MEDFLVKHMKYIFHALLLLVAGSVHAQFPLPGKGKAAIPNPVIWASPVTDVTQARVGDEITLTLTADIESGWYVYSSDLDPNLGPIPTTFTFAPHPSYELIGGVEAVKPKKKYEDVWKGEVTYFVQKATFRQKIRLRTQDPVIEISGEYQTCNEQTGTCLPPKTFQLRVTGLTVAPAPIQAKPKPEVQVPIPAPASDQQPTEPASKTPEESVTQPVTPVRQDTTAQAPQAAPVTEEESLLGFMMAAFLFGLVALLTPCVFPMIPMTVAFFTKPNRSKTRAKLDALVYSGSIVAVYTLIGAVFARVAGPETANFISTDWTVNLAFFGIFIAFALAFFGAFEITLPSSWANAADRQADKGGFAGVFFMALTLIIVSFSCTGPIVGSLLVQSAGGAILKPVAGMFAFSLAFALPFALFAWFPSLLDGLPRSGGWLNGVKVSLGFVELALAFKFLSTADQVYHWGLLDRHVYIAIWISIAAFMGLYYLGKIRLPHDSEVTHVSVPRLLLALACFSFVVYLVPGMFGAPLKALSGYLPPQASHDFDFGRIVRDNAASSGGTADLGGQYPVTAALSAKLHLPHGLNGYFDFDEALAAARKAGKPLFIDFTGHGCVNCRKMEDYVWGEAPVLSRLRGDFVMAALYVDERTVLPETAWVTSTYDGEVKKTVGAVNADLQISRFGNIAQPFYVLLDHDGSLLVQPRAYDLSVEGFVEFLETGKKEFARRHP